METRKWLMQFIRENNIGIEDIESLGKGLLKMQNLTILKLNLKKNDIDREGSA